MWGIQSSIRTSLCVSLVLAGSVVAGAQDVGRAGTTSAAMTYLDNGKQYVVVAIGGRDYPAEWVALGLP